MKILFVATVQSHICQFHLPIMDMLQKNGYEVHVAARNNLAEKNGLSMKYADKVFDIPFERSPFNTKNIGAYKQLKKIMKDEKYDIVHCHTPVGGILARLAGRKFRKDGLRMIYTAHGFHFYDGAPKKNWIIYYPIEKLLSRWTDVLITINKEDYGRAKQKFHAKETKYIPGVGVNIDRFELGQEEREQNRKLKREELAVPEKGFVLLSVGELQDRKNQRVVIKALHELNNPDIYYWAVGKGELFTEYQQLIEKYGLKDKVTLLGFRTDIVELCDAADCFVHPSVREGLGIAPLEAMAGGLPLISSYVNGIKDYTENGVSGCCLIDPLSVEEMKKAIQKMYENVEFRKKCGINNLKTVKRFDIKNTDEIMKDIYSQFL